MKLLTFQERDTIILHNSENITEIEAKDIQRVSDCHKNSISTLTSQQIKFGQFCGFLHTRGAIVELLPKMSLKIYGTSDSRRILISMLNASGHLDVKHTDYDDTTISNIHLLDVFIDDFCKKIYNSFSQEPPVFSIRRSEITKAIHGKILYRESIKVNMKNPSEFVCEYDDTSIDNFYNRVLKYSLRVLFAHASHQDVCRQLMDLLRKFSAVLDQKIPINEIERCSFDGVSPLWRPIFGRAVLFLKGASHDAKPHERTGLTMVYNMEELYEKVLRNAIAMKAHRLSGGKLYVNRYCGLEKNLSEVGFPLKPDITVQNLNGDGDVVAIFDAKWKVTNDTTKTKGVKAADIYQINAYASRYRCRHLALVYPISSLSETGTSTSFQLLTSDLPVINIITIDLKELSFSGSIGQHLECIITQCAHERECPDRC